MVKQMKKGEVKKEKDELNISNVLIEALPYIKKFHDKKIMIKYGGHAMIDKASMQISNEERYAILAEDSRAKRAEMIEKLLYEFMEVDRKYPVQWIRWVKKQSLSEDYV